MELAPHVFIFMGRSGCGKGTQVKLLMEKLKELDPTREIVSLETGKRFRDFIKGPTYTHELSKKIYDDGGLQPEFLTIDMWSEFFVQGIHQDSHVILDGTPRRYHEAFVLDSAVKFYAWPRPHVIYINISREEAVKRLMGRGRTDDNMPDITSRLDWFDTDVVRTLTFYQDNGPDYMFHEINGERPAEVIQEEIQKRVGLIS